MRVEREHGDRFEVDKEEHTESGRHQYNICEHVREDEWAVERQSAETVEERQEAIPAISPYYSIVTETGD